MHQPNINLPKPVAGEEHGGIDPNQLPEGQVEVKEQQGELPQQGSAPALPVNPLMQLSGDPVQSPPSKSVVTQQQAGTYDDMVAEDIDLIEKEWVERAKAIVEKTRNDPHEQNKELSRMKAEYIKKRYNKDVKVSE